MPVPAAADSGLAAKDTPRCTTKYPTSTVYSTTVKTAAAAARRVDEVTGRAARITK